MKQKFNIIRLTPCVKCDIFHHVQLKSCTKRIKPVRTGCAAFVAFDRCRTNAGDSGSAGRNMPFPEKRGPVFHSYFMNEMGVEQNS